MTRGVYDHTNNPSLFKKGHKGYSYWKGKHLSEETKKKISKKLKGQKLSFITKKLMSKARKGKPQLWHKGISLSLQHRKKIGRRGNKHWNWQGGISTKNERLRKSIEYKLWRSAVIIRDDYACQKCGKRQGWDKKLKKHIDIQADHIKSWSLYPELRFSIDNGRTLCRECHVKTETWGGNTKFTSIKLQERGWCP